MIRRMLVLIVRGLLWLRYRIRTTGLKAVARRGTRGILFLPNHPALIDPIIMVSRLGCSFAVRALADEEQVDRFVIRRLATIFNVIRIPDMAKVGQTGRQRLDEALGGIIDDLKRGRNVLLYPSGHLYRQRYESLAGTSAVASILEAIPDVRIVLARTRGLWGSGLSKASGGPPNVANVLKKGLLGMLSGGVLFMPRRRVRIDFVEPELLPRTGGREALREYMEGFYNLDAPPNTYVPYSIWERGGVRPMPEPVRSRIEGDPGSTPAATRDIVTEYLRELSGCDDLADDDELARDLGLDSLGRADLIVFIEKEFGFPQGDADSLVTVGDVMLAACGEGVAAGEAELKDVPSKWLAPRPDERMTIPPGRSIAEVFLAQARREPGLLITADQTAGARTNRQVVLAVLVLRKHIERLGGRCVGIMLPASVAADIVYLATLLAGKTPVMLNWTVGRRNMLHSIEITGVRHVLTSSVLVERLAARGTDFDAVAERFVFLEDVRKRVTAVQKLAAAVKARLNWSSLDRALVPATAAILFTSGSESLPKAVPLTHENLLANVRDVLKSVPVLASDRLIGILPPFHSFGLTTGTVLPLCLGVSVVHHPNPTEGKMLGRVIEAYGVTILIGTPTFLGGVLRASTREQLSGLRLAVTGAEKCPDRVYEALARQCPGAKVMEGYGVTECSPIISLNSYEAPEAGTIGKVIPSLEYVLVHPETGGPVGPGEAGVLLVRGPSVFDGYIGYDGPSPFVEIDGRTWYRTGDLVRADEAGVLTFVGRLKRFVKLGGEMISLPAIEEVLLAHYSCDADEAPVLAVEATPCQDHPEIVLFATQDLTRKAVNERIRAAGLSALHNVRRVIRLEEMPLLGTGKTDYRALSRRLRLR